MAEGFKRPVPLGARRGACKLCWPGWLVPLFNATQKRGAAICFCPTDRLAPIFVRQAPQPLSPSAPNPTDGSFLLRTPILTDLLVPLLHPRAAQPHSPNLAGAGSSQPCPGCALGPPPAAVRLRAWAALLRVQLAQQPLHAGEGRSAPAGVRSACVCRSALACRACAVCTRGSCPCLLLLPIPARRSGGVLGLLLAGCGRCACPRNQLLIPPLLTCAHRSGGVLGLLLAAAVGAVFTRGSWIFTPDAAVQAAVGQLAPIAMLALGICAGGAGGRVNSFE